MNETETFQAEIISDLEQGNLILPSLPEVALRVSDSLEDPEATSADLAEVIAQDMALSAQLIKVANSPLYRGRVSIDSVQTAVSRLGRGLVGNLVSSLIMKQLFQATSGRLDKHLQALWKDSAEVSAASQVIAAKQAGIKVDEAMLAGLIHNIGKIPILMKAEQNPTLLDDSAALETVIDELYAGVGEAILKTWNFPDSLIAVVGKHADISRNSEEGPDLVDVVQAAFLQNQFHTENALSDEQLEQVQAFKKLDIETTVSVVELDENSEEYAEAMALFGF